MATQTTQSTFLLGSLCASFPTLAYLTCSHALIRMRRPQDSDGGVNVSDKTFRNIDRRSTAEGPGEPADQVTQAEVSLAIFPETQPQKERDVTVEEELEIPDERETQVPQPTRAGKGRLFPIGNSRLCEKHVEQAVPIDDAMVMNKYKDYPLVQSMLQCEPIRNQILRKDGHKQIDYVKSNDGWVKTLFVIEVCCRQIAVDTLSLLFLAAQCFTTGTRP